MNDRLETLKKARERMIEDRDAHAKVLAAPFDRDKAERARNKFVETQLVIDAIGRAVTKRNASRRHLEPTRQVRPPMSGADRTAATNDMAIR